MNNEEFFTALKLMENEKGIPSAYIADKIAAAIVVAVRRDYGGREVVFCNIDCEQRTFDVFVRKTVVETVELPSCELTLDQAKEIDPKLEIGDTVDFPLDTAAFGRIVAQTAKHVIRQGIREVERGLTLEAFQSRNKELVTAVIQRIDPKTGNATVSIGHSEAVLPKAEQVPDEILREGQHIKVYIVDVKMGEKEPRVLLSRSHPGLVKRLFESEVPEIFDGTVEIKAVSRQAGSRTKLAVSTNNPEVEPIGACIGQRGARVNKIVDELAGEKIDIIKYSEDPVAFVSEALSPAKVLSVEILSEDPKVCRATVPDSQLSLAIGNKGQNVRLAARLTGWKIDIRPESGFYGEDDADHQAVGSPEEAAE